MILGKLTSDHIEAARVLTLKLLSIRASEATICPSEVARALVSGNGDGATAVDWRAAMPLVHASVDTLLGEGLVQLSWKGRTLDLRNGPYRISHGSKEGRKG